MDVLETLRVTVFTGSAAKQYQNWAADYWVVGYIAIVLYAVVVPSVNAMMVRAEAWKLDKLLFWWNIAMSTFSTVGLWYMLPAISHILTETGSLQCNNDIYHADGTGWWVTLFCYSKCAEFVDTAFLLLKKRKVKMIHYFHHIITAAYCWRAVSYRVDGVTGPPDSSCAVYCLLNFGVHAIMYGYYAVMTTIPESYKPAVRKYGKIITILQVVQMFVGTGFAISSYANCYEENHSFHDAQFFSLMMYLLYVFLFSEMMLRKFGILSEVIPSTAESYFFVDIPDHDDISEMQKGLAEMQKGIEESTISGFLGGDSITPRTWRDHGRRTSIRRPAHLEGLSIWRQLDYVSIVFMIVTHGLAIYTITQWSIGSLIMNHNTLLFMIFYYTFTALGITGGYHRLWSHDAYKVHPFAELVLMIAGSGSLQGSAIWWSRLHRAHHRFTDTDDDPYDSRRGFFYAHMGWLFFKKNKVPASITVKDLKARPILRWQHANYVWFGPCIAFLLPGIVAHYGWNDFWGGLLWAGIVRLLCVYHSTWCVNSVAHYFGEQPFDDTLSARNNIINAFFTMGEGYHNFHHEFPNDYRNGVLWYNYDPTKWMIGALKFMGLAYNLKRFPENEMKLCQLRMEIKQLQKKQASLVVPTPLSKLPVWNQATMRKLLKDGNSVVIIDGIVHDITRFVASHPGGANVLKAYNGKDATEAFNGGVYNHSNAARQLLSCYRLARMPNAAAAAANASRTRSPE